MRPSAPPPGRVGGMGGAWRGLLQAFGGAARSAMGPTPIRLQRAAVGGARAHGRAGQARNLPAG